MIVYRVINKMDGKPYIGVTSRSLELRKNQHLRDAKNNKYNFHFHRAIRKYGEENFEWEVIAKGKSIEDLNLLEKFFIWSYDSFDNGYNMTKGGDGTEGFNHTELAKKKIKEFQIGRKKSKEAIEKTRQFNIGRKLTDDHRKNLSISHKGQNPWNKGKRLSKEHRDKLKKNSWQRRDDIKDSDIIELRRKGLSQKAISEILLCHQTTIHDRLKKLTDSKILYNNEVTT